jgi:hypothetical protein
LSFSGELLLPLLLDKHGRTRCVEDASGLDSRFRERFGTRGQEEDTGKKAHVVPDRTATDKTNSAWRALIVHRTRVACNVMHFLT